MLPALAPALRGLVAVPLAPVLPVVQLHLHGMPYTPAFRRRLGSSRGRCCARRAIAALRRCLQKPWGALAKSLQSQWPLTMWYVVVPLDCEATRAVPSASTSTSPANTILTALSTRPLHSGNFAWALAAISA